jgi:hypothetical protein
MLPIRGKGTIEHFITLVAEKCPTYDAYARTSLTDLFSAETLAQTLSLSANTLESGALLNDGTARFTFIPLPRMAQASPCFGALLSDVNADGFADLYVVQNFLGAHREVGFMNGGLSLLLWGKGDGAFTPAAPKETGLVVPEEGRSAAITDVNGDGRPDIVIGINNGKARAFEFNADFAGQFARVRLHGGPGNPTGVGAKATIQWDDGSQHVAEFYAGGGYLSQSTSALYVGLGAGRSIASIDVRWPDGEITRHPAPRDVRTIDIRRARSSMAPPAAAN